MATKKLRRNRARGQLRYTTDSRETHELIDWALANKLPIRRPDVNVVKIGSLNYFPTKGYFNSDVAKSKKVVGVENFKRTVEKWAAYQRHKLESLWD